MSEERPEYVKCVAHTHVSLIGTSWCGRDVQGKFAFVGVDHAAENGRIGGYLAACPACVALIVAALTPPEEKD